MHLFKLLLLLIITQTAVVPIKIIKLDAGSIPRSIHYTGYIIGAVKYTDAEGEHMLITTETGITASKGKDSQGNSDAELFAYHYKITGATQTLSWQTHDFSKDCPVDVEARYRPNTFAVTDLNNDGKAEVWLMYTIACRGDVSPADMKIIMHEGDKKYAVRGTNQVQPSATERYGGQYTFDDAFKNGPAAFRLYAQQLWKKNLIEDFK